LENGGFVDASDVIKARCSVKLNFYEILKNGEKSHQNRAKKPCDAKRRALPEARPANVSARFGGE
jgi:hypothetical protein